MNTQFGEYNQVLEMKEYGYGGLSDLLRRTVTSYTKKGDSLNGNNEWRALPRFISLPNISEVFDGSGNRIAYTKYEYDTNPIRPLNGSNPPPLTFCNDSYCNSITERGNLTSMKIYSDVSGTTPTGEIADSKHYNKVGNLVAYQAEVGTPIYTEYKYTSGTAYAYAEEITTGDLSSNSNSGLQIKTTGTFDFASGIVKSATDADLQTILFENDPLTWRPIRAITPTGAYTQYNFDGSARTYSNTQFTPGNEAKAKSRTFINGLGKTYRQETHAGIENGVEVWNAVEAQHDILGRTKKTSNPFRVSSATPNGVYWTEMFYDSIGRNEKTISPNGSTKYNYYNEAVRPQGASSDPGQTHRVKDPVGREKWYRTDSDGNLAEVIEANPDGDGSVATSGFLTKYSYDRLGQLLQTQQGSQIRSFKYDSLGRLTRQKMSEMKATINDAGVFVGEGNGIWSQAFTYDKLSNITSAMDARGVTTNYSRVNSSLPSYPIDPLNRLFSVSYNTNGAANVLPSPEISFVYQAAGNVTQAQFVTAAGVSTTEFGFDTFRRINQKTTTLLTRPNNPMVVNYGYDSLSRVSDVTYPTPHGIAGGTQKNLHYDFDIVGRMTNLKVDNVDYASNFVFNVNEQVTSVKIGASGANQITETYNYNGMTGLLENQKVLRGQTSLLDLSYEYQQCSCSTGGSGQITKISDNLDPNRNRKYDYDALARLKKVTGGLNQSWSQEYKYDRFGNRNEVKALGVEALRSSEPNLDVKDEQNKIVKTAVPMLPPTSQELLSGVQNEIFNDVISDKNNKSVSKESAQTQTKYLNSKTDSASVNPPATTTAFDFDNDGKADISSWQRANGMWNIIKSSNNQTVTDQFGSNGNQIAPGDYDGDGKTDEAVWIPSSGQWWIKNSSNGVVTTTQWGASGDAIVPADYDGDGKTDIAVWRPSTGSWYVIRSSNGSWFGVGFGTGLSDDIPVSADYDGDGKADIAVWRPSNGVWYVYQTSNGQVRYTSFGAAGDIPVPSDFDADGKADVAVWRPSNGFWYHIKSSNNSFSGVQWGAESFGDVPVAADYDGDRKTDIAVFRPSSGSWYILRSMDNGVTASSLGNSGHVAVPSAYIRRSSAPKGQSVEIPRDGFANLSYDQTSNRITTSGFLYDSAGNQTQSVKEDGTISKFQYDAAGRLIKVRNASNQTIATYTYGNSRERLITQNGDDNSTNRTYYAWEGGSVISEYVDSPANALKWAKSYIFMGGRLLATHEDTGSTELLQFHHSDRLGTRVVSNPATGTSFEQATLPFGTALESESTGATNRRFTSYDRSASTGMDYAVNRFYSSSQGRFTTVDPITMKAASLMNPQTLNLYAYTANDPINRTDPDGLFWGALFGFIAGFFKKTNFNFNFNYKGIPFSFGFQGHFKNVYVGIAGFNVQITGQNSIFNQFKSAGGGFSAFLFGETCGVNPLTGFPGINAVASNVEGEMRPGIGGGGFFNSRRPKNKTGIHGAIDIGFGSNSAETIITSGPQKGLPQFMFSDTIYFLLPGTIKEVGYNKGLGYYVRADHGNGIVSTYAHLAMSSSTLWTVGQTINTLKTVGLGGQSGNAQGQPQSEAHLHFIITIDGKPVDPVVFLNNACP